MNLSAQNTNYLKWLDRAEYPFENNYFELSIGKIHYIDEGKGEPIVMVHGNPGWSFEFRNIVKELSKTHRCIAPDHIGFGLSNKPYDWDFLPKSHAQNFELFMDSLNLDKITLVVIDWGGPIGLSYALKHPEKIKKISREVTELLNQGVNFYSEAPRYYYIQLADLKIEMISKATEDARIRAEKIAAYSNGELGALQSAKMDVFQITGQNSTENYSWGGTFNTSSRDKTASITMKLVYKVK